MCAKYLYSNYVQENGSEIPYQKNKGQGFKKGKDITDFIKENQSNI